MSLIFQSTIRGARDSSYALRIHRCSRSPSLQILPLSPPVMSPSHALHQSVAHCLRERSSASCLSNSRRLQWSTTTRPSIRVLVRGINWAPDSCDESNDSSVSEVRFVMDSLAGETEVPDSQEIFADDDRSIVDALLCKASTDVSTFKLDKELHAAASLLLPVFLPCMYGS